MTTREPAELDELRVRPDAPTPRRRRRWPWVLGAIATLVVVAVVAAGLYVSALAHSYDDNRRTVEAPTVQSTPDGPVNILLLGSDSRGEEGSGAPDAEGQRSDTMMLVHIPKDRQGVYVMSILRDLYVDIPGHGKGKVNSALSKGGYELTLKTVEDFLGVPVNHLVEVDFQGFRGVTAALGGVAVCNPTAFSSGVKDPSYYPRGRILLQDTAALRYVRERHAFADGDLTRVKNQQRVVSAALDRFLSFDVLADPRRTMDVVATLSRHLTVDAGLDSRTVAGYAWDLRSLSGDEVKMFTVPNSGGAVDAAGQQILLPDEEKTARLKKALAADDLASYIRELEAEAKQRRADRAAEEPTPMPSESSSTAPSTPAPAPAVSDPCP